MDNPELFDAKPGPRSWHETFRGELALVASVLIFFGFFRPSGWALWAYGVAAAVLIIALVRAKRRDQPHDYRVVGTIVTIVLVLLTGITALRL